MKSVGVIILGYKSDAALTNFVEGTATLLSKNGIAARLYVVLNYATYNDYQLSQKHINNLKNYKYIQIICKPKAAGQAMGWDMQCGIAEVKEEITVIVDGDGQILPQAIIDACNAIVFNNYDAIFSHRIIRHDGFARKVVTTIYNALFNLLFHSYRHGLTDVNSKPKAILTKYIHAMPLQSDKWFIDGEIAYYAITNKLKCHSIEVQFYKNSERKSLVNIGALVSATIEMLKFKVRKKKSI